jgi:carboxypeptidase C (cathepsin A)
MIGGVLLFRHYLLAVAVVSLFCVTPLYAAQTATGGTEKAEKQHSLPADPVTTRHIAQIGGKDIAYTAVAGTLPLLSEAGEAEAEIFYVAYRADQPATAKHRPVLFMFNGGPGAAAVWLHLGAIGPKKVEMLPDGNMPKPPFRLADNPYSWLDRADLVFVDPVGTGYSRPAKPDQQKNFSSVRGDIESLGKFIRLYLTRNQLWDAPVFLVGESYGTFRCAGLSEYLLEHGVALNGLILVSSILNLETTSFDNGNDLPYALFLPSYAATAWYHHKLAPELQADLERTLADAEQWAATSYQQALFKGDRLSAEERRATVERLAYFTGLPPAFIENRNLRVDSRAFVHELLRDRRLKVGYMDSRYTAPDLDPGSGGFDPTVATIRPPFTSMINSYLREELGYHSDLEYFTLGGGTGHWDWEAKNGYADTSDNLRNAMAKNPYMKVLVASGVFDLATPHFATDYTLAHLGLSPALRQNISVHRYRAGHMMYLEKASLAQMKKDLTEFLSQSLK